MEAMQRFSDPPLAECCHCNGGEMRKLISMSTFHLKGSGWYTTDYAGKNQSTSGGSSDTTKAESKESKTEAKTEAKTDGGV
jgi:putative FmdB family regulatory protein